MSLEQIRSKLRRLEDTICISLFERSQFKLNPVIYTPGKIRIPNFEGSFFAYLFGETEKIHASAGRYEDPEEHPFFIESIKPIIPRKKEDYTQIKPVVNLNDVILNEYMALLPNLCPPEDDNEYGSAAVVDIYGLQAISKRVHIGEQVAEAKYQEDSKTYNQLIATENINSIVAKLRNVAVEEENLRRIREKSVRYNLPANVIVEFFEKKVMPLTIKVEVSYFMSKKVK